MPIGGRWSVRGFRENELVYDQAIVTSAELRIPLVQEREWATRLDLAPFFDQGAGANRDAQSIGQRSIGAAGVGIRWQTRFARPFGWSPSVEFYWGFLRYHRNPNERGNLQDHGIHFAISWSGS